ncbi:hypothetical protein [Vacuolonema iberomarrocanum]|uniref:hypothetical protein n=1 Tax=Vacuolonema iberomarrocanum TaxID=3454632 RepID=UPI0019E3FBBD|nr:hypothetical protein [filamentous cyanobacterium LEGE 07170]
MQRWLTDSLLVGIVSVTAGVGVSLFAPNAPRSSAIAGSTVGAVVSSALVLRRKDDEILGLEDQLADDQKEQLTLNLPPEVVSLTTSQPPPAAAMNGRSLLPTLSTVERATPVIQWFTDRDIRIENYRQADADTDEIFNRHAKTLGDRHKDDEGRPLLAPLLKQMKWAIAKNRGLQHHLKGATQQQITTQTQFCNHLLRDSLLSSYFYNKTTKIIHGAIQDRTDVRHFFNGEWFERFICHKTEAIFQDLNVEYFYVMNPVIQYDNGDTFELDLFFLINGIPILIECKTGGDFNQHLKRFESHRNRLAIEPEQAFLVILDLEDAQTQRLSKFWNFKVVNPKIYATLLPDVLTASKSEDV